MLLLILIITPIIASLASLTVRRKIRTLEIICAISASIELIVVLMSIIYVSQKQAYAFSYLLSLDALSAIVLLTTAVIAFSASFYSIGYLREEVKKEIIGFHRVRQYFVLFHIFLTVMFLAISTVSPIIMWLAVEATTLSTAFLISFYSKQSSLEAAWKYLVINTIGLLLAFFGIILFFTSAQSIIADRLINWETLSITAILLNPLVAKIAFIFVLIGFGTKAGLAPMHTWLPDAHSKAPPPISALLSGALLNIAILAIIRFRNITDIVVDPTFTQNLMLFFGTISILIPAFIMVIQKNYKRLFAYSSIEHMGIIALGFGFGGLATFASLLHMIFHSLTKSILFFTAGNIFLKYSSTKIFNIKGLLKIMPITGIILLLGFLAICGIPPFGIFITEFNILSAGIINFPIIVVLVVISLTIIFVSFLKKIVRMTLSPTEEPLPIGEFNYFTIIPPIFLLCLLIILGIYLPYPIKTLLEQAVNLIN